MSITPIEIAEAKRICNTDSPTDYEKKRLIKLRMQAEGKGRRMIPLDAVDKCIEKHGLDGPFNIAKKHFQ